MEAGRVAQALQTWYLGLDGHPDARWIVPLARSASRADALARQAALAPLFPVIAVPFKDGVSWQVVVVPVASELSRMLPRLRATLSQPQLEAVTMEAWRLRQAAALDAVATAPVVASAPFSAVPAAPAPAVSAMPAASQVSTYGAVAVARPSPDTFARRFRDVERQLAQGRHEAALQAAIALDAEFGPSWQGSYLRGAAASGMRRWEDAMREFTASLQINPSSPKTLLARAITQQELGQHSGAVDDLRQARKLDASLAEVSLNLGLSLEALGRREEAFAEWRRFMDMTASREEYARMRAWVAARLPK